MWDINLKATINKKNKQKFIATDNSTVVIEGKVHRIVKSKKSPIYGDGKMI